MLLTKEVEIICKTRKKYYISKGYDWIYLKPIIVKVDDLSNGSHELIKILCDYCLENNKITVVERSYSSYLISKNKSEIDKDCCEGCWSLKLAETMNIKYGYDNASNVREFQDKRVSTYINNFGVDNPMKTDDIVLKAKQANITKYGVSHIMKLEGEYDKRIIKMRETMYQKGEGVKSSQQIYLHDIFGGELNYPVGKYLLDIAFINNKIYCEYDGSGHNLQVHFGNITEDERQTKELKRYYFLKNRDWKFIRIISVKDRLPNKKILKYLFDLASILLKNGRSYFEINIDKGTIKYNNIEQEIDFGKLRKISKKDIEKAS